MDESTNKSAESNNKSAESNKSAAMKALVRKIKLLAEYLQVSYSVAQAKYYELKRNDIVQLREILEKAEKGEKGDVSVCAKCGRSMIIRNGRMGDFYGCSGYPECKFTRNIKSAVVEVTVEQKESAKNKMNITLEFISAIGGLDEARKWINIVTQSLSNGGNP